MNLLPRPRMVALTDALAPKRVVEVRHDPSLPAQGYELHIDENGVVLIGADDAGVFYGSTTVDQLGMLHDGAVPMGTVRDHPDHLVRGVMLDVSRDKVPTMATLRTMIQRLAAWKVNHVELYMEHTFAYRDHHEVTAPASPFTPDEILELDAFCRTVHVELTPNQNCLGHFERWLEHDRYRHLALQPGGFVDPSGMRRPAMTLDPTNQASLTLVRELLGELLPLFSSPRVHVGLDETWELGRRRLGELVDWLWTLRQLDEVGDRELLVWGDMLGEDPTLLRALPDGVTICEWGYEATHPFEARAEELAAIGAPFWVAPGTSSWLSIAGRLSNAIENCASAARAARTHGAAGYLVTDWGDQGHLQPLPVSEPALAYAAGVSWCEETNAGIDLGAALSAHAFADPSGELAAALIELGDLYLAVTPQLDNMSALVVNLYYPQLPLGSGFTSGLTVAGLDDVANRVDDARHRLSRAAPGRADAAQAIEEVTWCADVLALLVEDGRARLAGDGTLSSIPSGLRAALAGRVGELIDRHRASWRARNRPGGLDRSVGWLDHLRVSLETGYADPAWAGITEAG